MNHHFSKLIVALLLFTGTHAAWAHCEVPCGIYHDELRIEMMREDIQTIQKAMQQIKALSNQEDEDYHQIIRWVITKEDHANKIQETVKQYFLTQRIKIVADTAGAAYEKYIRELSLLHEMLVYAMKAKQGTDEAWIDKLNQTLTAFDASYFEGKHRHLPEGSDH